MDIEEIKHRVIPKKVKIGRNLTYGLTEIGKTKAEDFGAVRGVTLRVLSHLNDFGPCNVREMSHDLNIPEDDLREILKRLATMGYIRPVGAYS